MSWYSHPETVDRLAAEYVMGSMSPAVKRRFESVMMKRTDVAMAVQAWSEKTLPLLMGLPEQVPSAAMWADIERRTMPAAPPASKAAPWWQRWLSPLPAGALAMGLVVGAAVPLALNVYRAEQSDLQLPESYVGVLATAQGKPGLIVSSLRQGTTVDFKVLTPVPLPAGQVFFLWRIDKTGAVKPLGSVPQVQGKFAHLTLPEPAEKVFFPAVELAVSIEATGSQPASPTGGFVYRGLCGKLWK